MSVSYKSYEIGKDWKRKGDSFVMSRQNASISQQMGMSFKLFQTKYSSGTLWQ